MPYFSTMNKLLSTAKRVIPRVQQNSIFYVQKGVYGSNQCFSTSNESHDDFKPHVKGATIDSIAEQIEQEVKTHKVFVFMKGVPEAPMCGFSNMACRILDAYDVKFGSANVLSDPELREGIKKYTHWPTIPQVFIKGEFIGGSDILYQMHQNGELKKILKDETI